MTVVFDTNVVLDVLLNRPFFVEPAANLLARAERREVQGFACATTITTIFYLARKAVGLRKARQQVGTILSLLNVAPVNDTVLKNALNGAFDDFEDAVIAESARQVQAHCIVTRNIRDFAASRVPVYTPPSLIAFLDAT